MWIFLWADPPQKEAWMIPLMKMMDRACLSKLGKNAQKESCWHCQTQVLEERAQRQQSSILDAGRLMSDGGSFETMQALASATGLLGAGLVTGMEDSWTSLSSRKMACFVLSFVCPISSLYASTLTRDSSYLCEALSCH